ncbi:MAG TPA: hypothetical protein VJP40_00685 [bacterium]|nr:hypothetical protein [bacterium]
MSQDICIDPNLPSYDYSELVCRAAEESPTTTTSVETNSTALNPPLALRYANSSNLLRVEAKLRLASLFQRGESRPALFRDSAEFRRRMIRSALADRTEPRATGFGDALASGLWGLAASVLPLACSSHPPLHGDEGDGSGSGGSDSGSGGSDAGPPAVAPHFSGVNRQALAPCGNQGMITDLDDGLGVCANYVSGDHHLFSWSASSAGATSIIPLTNAPDQVLRGADGAIYISTHQNPGLSVVRPSPGSESHYAFPTSIALSGQSSSGRVLSSTRPGFPKGLVEIDGRLFVATSNYDEAHSDFQPGTVLAFDPSDHAYSALPTSAFNPTGVAEANGRLLVVNSGAIDRNGQVTSDGSFDVFNPNTFELEASLPLGRRGAGLAGEIALSADGNRAILPTADNSGRLIVVDWASSQVRELDLRAAGISGSRIFFSNLQVSADGNFAVVSNFNDGRVYTVDLNQGTLVGSSLGVDAQTNDFNGLSDGLRLGAEYFVGFGPEVLRLNP